MGSDHITTVKPALKRSINLAEGLNLPGPDASNLPEVEEVRPAEVPADEPTRLPKRLRRRWRSHRVPEVEPAEADRPPEPRPLPTDPRVIRRVVLAGVLAVLMVAGTIVGSYLWYQQDSEAPVSVAPAAVVEGSSVLVVATDLDEKAISVGVMTVASQELTSVVIFPSALLIEVPGFGTHRLGDAHVLGGLDSVRHAIMNELGIDIAGVAMLTPGDLAATLDRNLEVTLTDPFLQPDYQGAVVTAGVGTASYAPDEVEAMLLTVGTGGEIEFLQRQRSVWEAYLLELSRTPGLVDSFADEDEAGARILKSGLAADRVVTTVAPVRQVGVGGSQLLGLENDPAFFDLHFAPVRQALNPRPRVELLNGTREVGITAAIAGDLIDAGFWILRTDNADRSTYRDTLVVAQGAAGQQEAVLVRDHLGFGEIVIEQSASGSVDVSVILGADAVR